MFRWDSWSQPLKAFSASGVFPPFVGHFFKRARNPEVKLRHVVYEVWLVSYLFFSFQIWHFRKWIITSIGQSKHMSWELQVSTPYEFLLIYNRGDLFIKVIMMTSTLRFANNSFKYSVTKTRPTLVFYPVHL